MKTVLVTGAGGYIGSRLVPKLLDRGYQVKAVDRFFFGQDKLADHPALMVMQEDTRRLKEEQLANVDAVVDLVALSNDPSGAKYVDQTWQINHVSRVRTAYMAKKMGVKQYILPSSASIYGCQNHIVDENSHTNPLTTYAQANERAEQAILPLACQSFCVTVMRQSTVFGYSPRMRFDLAINGMTYGAWQNKVLPLMRDGTQYRPMIHVDDTAEVMCQLLETEQSRINGEIFNVGGESNNYQLGALGREVSQAVGQQLGETIDIEWYGDPDHRSYLVDFSKIVNVLGWQPEWNALMGAQQMVKKLDEGKLVKDDTTITLHWYDKLMNWHQTIRAVEKYGGILDL